MNKPWQIPRRTFLKGLGTALALPMLESMAPGFSRAAPSLALGGGVPKRMAFVYVPNGMNMSDWTPKREGEGFDLPSILQPLQPFQQDFLVLSGLTQVRLQPIGIVQHEIENALVVKIPFGPIFQDFAFKVVREEPIEDEARIHFGRHGGKLRLPRNIERISAAITGVAVPRLFAVVATQFEGRKACVLAKLPGCDLIDGDSDANIRSLGFSRLTRRQIAGGGAGMVAGAISVRTSLVMGQPAQDEEILLEGLKRL